jgi:hypothetical protein
MGWFFRLELGSNHLIYSIKYASQPTGERRLDIFQPRDKLEGRRYTVPPVAEADAFLRNVGRSEGRLIAHLAYGDLKLTRRSPR